MEAVDAWLGSSDTGHPRAAGNSVRICIHRGTREIGGTCIEVEAQGKRIALDVGLPLDAPDGEPHERLPPPVPGFTDVDDTLLAVLISHPHLDHYGLARHIRPSVPIYIGESAHRIMQAASAYVPNGHAFTDPHFLANDAPVHIGPFRITPYLACVDQSPDDHPRELLPARPSTTVTSWA